MIKRIQHYCLWGLLTMALIGVLQSIYANFQIHQTNQLIRQVNKGEDIEPDQIKHAPLELLLARASYLKNKRRYNEAQTTLSKIISQKTPRLQAISRYNLGNTYLAQAIEQVEFQQINEATALAALAKQAYRYALSLDSGYWDAKYNLEVAIRLLPEMDRITMKQDDPVPQEKAKLWATVPGFPRGLP